MSSLGLFKFHRCKLKYNIFLLEVAVPSLLAWLSSQNTLAISQMKLLIEVLTMVHKVCPKCLTQSQKLFIFMLSEGV